MCVWVYVWYATTVVVTSDYFDHTKLRIFIQSKHRPLINKRGRGNVSSSDQQHAGVRVRRNDNGGTGGGDSFYDVNVFGLTDKELSERIIMPIDISKQPEQDKYIRKEDPARFQSSDTGLGKVCTSAAHYERRQFARMHLGVFASLF